MNSTDFIKRARTLLKLDRDDFATRLGLSKKTIYRYERGGFIPESIELLVFALLREDGFSDNEIDRKLGRIAR